MIKRIKRFFSRKWLKVRIKYYNFICGIRSLIKWFPTIWKDRDYDGEYLLIIIREKLNHMVESFENTDTPYVGIDEDIANMRECRNLIDHLIENDIGDVVDERLTEKWGGEKNWIDDEGVLRLERENVETEEDEKEYKRDYEKYSIEDYYEIKEKASRAMEIISDNYRNWWT